MEIELLLGKLLDLHGQGVELSAQFGLANELMALGRQLLQANQFQAFVGQGVPIGLGLLQLFGGAGVFILQQAQVAQPGVLLLQLLELRLLGLELLLGVVETLVQLGPGLGGQRRDTGGLVLQLPVAVLGLLGLVEGAAAEAGIQGGVGELFQQFTAIVVIGLEERAELALGQQHGPGELFEVQAQGRFELGLVFAFLARQQLIVVQVPQALAAGLQLAAGFFPGAIGFPAGPIAASVDAAKIHFGIAIAGTSAQQRCADRPWQSRHRRPVPWRHARCY